ncbi:uncharacterized protein MONBRDRAFT_21885 [Monosiga brevicollis MX1]|uniref:COMM domain-containing protein n=1 Tax=Monosiga brevicollis TaxID=81824 RepID=A9UNW7_MONBE|nr:uncharacterized protein MONBRDRAFT_21885 [Monosiga brevicollis MX1]EDQ92317.1 predicted protein [Monosiga brevicollis MX1]|eukprot:XP_001742079.1 hypothetical protein [Monosiga brevicollis MX1]
MLLVLSAEHKAHLQLLGTLDPAIVTEFGNIAIDFLQNGTNQKVYQSAAKKLGLPLTDVSSAVEGIMFLLLECVRLNIEETDLHDSLLTLSFPTEFSTQLIEIYKTHHEFLRYVLDTLGPEVAQRSLYHQHHLSCVLRLDTTRPGERGAVQSNVLETDVTTLLHVTQQLKQALKEATTAHHRKVSRSVRS